MLSQQKEIVIDLSKFNELNIHFQLSNLEQDFKIGLQQNKLNRGYWLILKSSNANSLSLEKTFEALTSYIRAWLATAKEDSYFFCHTIAVNLMNLPEKATDSILPHLNKMITLIDKAKLTQLILEIPRFSPLQIKELKTVLQNLKHAKVMFNGLPNVELALDLEAVAELALQPIATLVNTSTYSAKTASKQSLLFTKAKINALLEQDIVLPQISSKIGVQHKYQFAQEVKQQSEVKILQSWQIDQRQEVKHEARHQTGFYFDKIDNIISWHDINAALDINHPEHKNARNKLGEEILQYNFKDRNLLDLWQRITGNIALTKQNVIPSEEDSFGKLLQFYSPYVPKQITVNTLETFVRYPHLFQDGVSLMHLHESINFLWNNSILYKKDKHSESKEGLLALKIIGIPKPDTPSTIYHSLISKGKFPGKKLLQAFNASVGFYQAWHYWRRLFPALNFFNEQGIELLQERLFKFFENTADNITSYINYSIQSLNHYHYRKIANQLTTLVPNTLLFATHEELAEKEGQENALSTSLIDSIPESHKTSLHVALCEIFNEVNFAKDKSSLPDKSCRHFILSNLTNSLSKENDHLLENAQYQKILDHLGPTNEQRFMELLLSHHISKATVIFNLLAELLNVWGDIGLKDFADVFLTPSMNFAYLCEPIQQAAFHQLYQLTQIEYHWWQQLTRQHAEQSGYSDFAGQMQMFHYFLGQLRELKLDDQLAIPCPLTGIVNMTIDLSRLLTLLELVKNPAEQWRNLENLDWRADAVIKAVQEQKFNFVSAEMELNQAHEQKLQDAIINNKLGNYYRQYSDYDAEFISNYSCRYSSLIDSAPLKEQEDLFKLNLLCFFRFIGREKYVAPMRVYQNLLGTLQLPNEYTVIEHIVCLSYQNEKLTTEPVVKIGAKQLISGQVLTIIAHAMTGPRALDSLPEQEQERSKLLNEFLIEAYECALEESSCKQMQEKCNKIKAVSYEALISILGRCIDMVQVKNYEKEKKKLRLNLLELKQILQQVKKAEAAFHKLKDPQLIVQHQFDENWNPQQIWGRADNQLLNTKVLIDEYHHYYLESLQRIIKYNSQSNYSLFLLFCTNLIEFDFSFENKGRLIRTVSLLTLKYDNYIKMVPQFVLWLNQLKTIEKLADSQFLNQLIHAFSRLVPTVNMDSLIALNRDCLSLIETKETLNLAELMTTYFPHCKQDEDLADEADPNFYDNANSLEQTFAGLGGLYPLLKNIILHKHPIKFGEDRNGIWSEFLAIIHQIKSDSERLCVLQTLKDIPFQFDLARLNPWLKAILLPQKEKPPFHADFLNNLSITLVNHPLKADYIDLTRNWFNGRVKQPTSHYTDFIKILVRMAVVDLPRDFLINIATTINYLSRLENLESDWSANVIRLFDAWQAKKLSTALLNDVFSALQQFAKMAIDKKSTLPLLDRVLAHWIKNIEQTFALTQSLAKAWEKDPQRAFAYFLIIAQVKNSSLSNLINYLYELASNDLEKLSACYEVQPVPNDGLLIKLLNHEIDIAHFIAEHTSNPHAERDRAKLSQQFDDEILWPYLEKVKALLSPADISNFTQLLPRQLKLINELGYEEFRKLTVAELQKKLHNCREIITTTSDPAKKLIAYLTAVSIIREVIYKTSSSSTLLWLSPIQLLGILSFINHLFHKTTNKIAPLFLQMATGEGKSLLAVVLALLSWLQGMPVSVVTHRASLALREALCNKKIFEAFGIESKQLTADSYRWQLIWKLIFKEDKPEFTGIYYVDFNDLALIYQQRLLETGEAINNMSFVIDEADEIILHNLTENNLTKTIGNEKNHPYSWVFEALASYLNNYNPKKEALTLNFADLVTYIQNYSPLGITATQKIDFLLVLPDYLQAAWQAKTLTEQEDFVSKPQQANNGQDYYAAVLLEDKAMPENVSFNGLVQQALHGRLNYEMKKNQRTLHYPVAPETQLFSTMSPNAVLNWMNSCGLVSCLSATVGSNAETQEMNLDLGFTFIRLPKSQAKTRVDYPVRFCDNEAKQLQFIAEICQRYSHPKKPSKTRAILIVVENIAFANKVNTFLAKQSSEFTISILHADIKEVSDATLTQMERQSGQPRHILIAVSGLISRGFDIKLNGVSQVVVITTYLKNWVDEIQVKGRCGRINSATGVRNKGKFYSFYNLALENKRYPNSPNSTEDILLNPEGYKKRQYFSHYCQESAQRLHRQLTSLPKNHIQTDFFQFWSNLFNDTSISKSKRDQIMSVFADCLKKITAVTPLDDFSDPNTPINVLRDYNILLIMHYEEALNIIEEILNRRLLNLNHVKSSGFLSAILLEQQSVISKRKLILARGPDKPQVKVYERWKNGVQCNAYLDPGKQSLVNYYRHTYKSLWLTAEQKQEIKLQKNNVENHQINKRDKKYDFMKQLRYRVAFLAKPENTPLIKPYSYLTLINADENNGLVCVEKKLDENHLLRFIHDPFLDKNYQITLYGKEANWYWKLQTALQNAYQSQKISLKLNFKITCYQEQNSNYYLLSIDFSDHAFDEVNREELFAQIGKYFDVDVQKIFSFKAMPSLEAMKNVFSHLQALLRQEKMSADIHKALNSLKLSADYTRKNCFELIFLPLINCLNHVKNKLPKSLDNLTLALQNFSTPVEYLNFKGKKCISSPMNFTTVYTLLENQKKQNALKIINEGLAKIIKSPLKNSLLPSLQQEYLINLGLLIIKSARNIQLQDIYQQWLTSTLLYKNKIINPKELTLIRDEQSGYFFSKNSKTPDLSDLCTKIEGLTREINNEDLLMSTSCLPN